MTLHSETKFYEGKPCSVCGNTTRYQATNSCKECVTRRNAKHEAKNIRARWRTIEIPCEDCGGLRVYKKSGACFDCSTTEAVKKKTVKKVRTVDDDYADIISGFIKGKWQAI